MKVEMQFFGYFFSASAKKVRELKIMSFFHRLKCLDKLNYSSPRFSYDHIKPLDSKSYLKQKERTASVNSSGASA